MCYITPRLVLLGAEVAFSANYSPAVAALNGSGTSRFTSSLQTGYRAGFWVLERELKTSPTVPVCTFPLSFFFFFFGTGLAAAQALLCSWELASLPAVLIEKGPSGEADRPREYQMIGVKVWSGFSMGGVGVGGIQRDQNNHNLRD